LECKNLARSVSLEGLPVPVRILSEKHIVEEVRESGDIAYLRFQPAQQEDDALRVTLEARIVPQDPGVHALGLGEIQVRLQRVDGR
jgi:hypothetical protein